jgi:surface antigen
MLMAIEMNNRTKILAGVVVLAAAGAGAWFFLFQDASPPPRAVVTNPAGATKAAAKAPGAAKAPDASKAVAAAPAPAAETTAAKPAAQAAAKAIPTNPDQLVAEVIESSGLAAYFQTLGSEMARGAASGGQTSALSEDDKRALSEAMQRAFESGKITAEASAKLKENLDAERMARFLEILRQPIAQKMASQERRSVQLEAVKEFAESMRKNPPPAARAKLIQALDGVTQSSQVSAELVGEMAREMVDAMLAELHKAGKKVPQEARQSVAAQQNAIRGQVRAQAVGMLYFIYRDTSDEDLAAYVKLLDTDTGRWGIEHLNDAVRAVLGSRFATLGKDIAHLALAKRMSTVAKAPAPEAAEPLPKAQAEAPADKPAAGAAAAPAEPVGYRRPANIRELYTHYNDVISATVMRDGAAVKELLDDGKSPNLRQADGMTPLMIAVGNGDANIATLLLQKGADPNLRASGGATALSIAKARGSAGAGLIPMLQASGAKE